MQTKFSTFVKIVLCSAGGYALGKFVGRGVDTAFAYVNERRNRK